MLTKRIIPCMDIKNGEVVKGKGFKELQYAGNPVELAAYYSANGADELVFLDITATNEKRKILIKLVKEIACEITIPFTVGGGINNISVIEEIMQSGADKVSLNTAIFDNPELVHNAAKQFGSQAVVAAIDIKREEEFYYVYKNAGTQRTNYKVDEWCKHVYNLGAGEILLTSIDCDGKKNGYDIKIFDKISSKIMLPLIASGGAGKIEDFSEVFLKTNVDACLAASVFHYGEIEIKQLKEELYKKNISVRIC